MPLMAKFALLAGSLSGALAVVFGAFGAHALKSRIATESLSTFQTGVSYQMYHALALLLVGSLMLHIRDSVALEWSARLFLAGTLLFSGSLYLLATTSQRWPGPITPLGGLCFMLAWALLAYGVYRA